MKKLLTIRFLITLVVSFLVFNGLELLLDKVFNIDLHHTLSFGGIGTIVIVGLKFHIFCCVLPTAISTFICARKKHDHCNCNHDHVKE